MANFLLDNTYIVQNSAGTALAWLAGARIQQIRIAALDTTASVVFQIAAGTPIFEWRFITHGAVSVGSATAVVPAIHVIPMGGVQFKTAWIPTTMTAATAWIDFA